MNVFRAPAALLVAILAVAMLAAGPLITPPVVIVFPFHSGDGMDPNAGPDYAQRLTTAMNAAGGLVVKDGPADTAAADYLHVAKAAGADYYLSGYVATIGGRITAVEQLVSARSGTLVWGHSTELFTATDIHIEGQLVHDSLITYVTRGYQAIAARPAATAYTPTPLPQPTRSAATRRQAGAGGPPEDLPNEAYGYSSKPTAAPKIYASTSHPSRFAIVQVGTNATPTILRDYATTALIAALARKGQTALPIDPLMTRFPLVQAAEICAATGSQYFVLSSIALKRTEASPEALGNSTNWTEASFSVSAFDCRQQKLVSKPVPNAGGAVNWQAAVTQAADAVVRGYLLKLGSERAS